MVHTYKTKSTKDFDVWFISLRIIGNIIWLVYAIDRNSLLMLINNSVTVFASLFIGYYKLLEKEKNYRKLAYNEQLCDDSAVLNETQLNA